MTTYNEQQAKLRKAREKARKKPRELEEEIEKVQDKLKEHKKKWDREKDPEAFKKIKEKEIYLKHLEAMKKKF